MQRTATRPHPTTPPRLVRRRPRGDSQLLRIRLRLLLRLVAALRIAATIGLRAHGLATTQQGDERVQQSAEAVLLVHHHQHLALQ
jgi:hypothetical protein